jgi:predicted Zn-dependent protease
LLGEYRYRSGKFDAAEGTLNKVSVAKSPFPQVQFLLGNLALRKKQLDPAVDHIQKSLAVNSADSPSRSALAQTPLAKGRPADREEIQKLLQRDPRNTTARLLKSSLDIGDKKYPNAEAELTALEKEEPDNPAVRRQLGLYYEARGRTSDAEKSLTRAVERSPQSEESFRNLIVFYLTAKQPDRDAEAEQCSG